ncbi:MAG: hypothetical protein A2511_00410 [Deltaproteobacteria bacterium RIFOXYD12_FULL_50_9]|nr:MAG: hypothetical protein A2511_00410 [Deltaproteobacteria bacterium RIFOXYD12_FULL_50_9]
MPQLHSERSRSYLGRSAPQALRKKGAATVKVVVLVQKSAEAILDKESTIHGGVVAGNEPGLAGIDSPCRRAELKEGKIPLCALMSR